MIRAIVACDPSGVIGVDGKIPWRYSADFKHFKASTLGGVCVMGRKTYDSLPTTSSNVKLPGRRIVVVSRHMEVSDVRETNVSVEFTIHRAIETVQHFSSDVWVCGGGEIYKAAAEMIDEWHVTMVPAVIVPDGAIVTYCNAPSWDTHHRLSADVEQPEGFAEAGLEYRVLKRNQGPRQCTK